MRATRSIRRGGVVATEFALVLLVVVLIALICVDFGRFAYTHIAVRNAARAGGGYGIMNPYPIGDQSAQTSWQTGVQTAARDELTGQNGYVSNDLTTAATADSVDQTTGLRKVEVTATYGDGTTTGFRTIVSWPGIPDRVQLRTTVVMCMIR